MIESFRTIYKLKNKQEAINKFKEWKQKIEHLKIDEFNSVVNSLDYHLENIMNLSILLDLFIQ